MTEPSRRTLKYLLLGGVAFIVLVAAGILAWYFVSNARILKKSIMDPLTTKELQTAEKKDPRLSDHIDFVYQAQNACVGTPKEDTYRPITYERLLDFLSIDEQKVEVDAQSAYDSYCKQYDAKVNQLVDKWSDYIQNHDPSRYLSLSFNLRYMTSGEGSSARYYPGFWVDITYPRGEIADCVVAFALANKENGNILDGSNAVVSLNDLKTYTKSADYRYNITRSEPTFYDEYRYVYEVRSVTLKDGSYFSLAYRDKVPREMLQYLQQPCAEYKGYVISELIDPDFEDEDLFFSNYRWKFYNERDSLCNALLHEFTE